MPTAAAAALGSRAAVVAVMGSQARNRSVATRRGDTTMRMSDDPAPGDYDDYHIASILGSESSTFRLDQAILFVIDERGTNKGIRLTDELRTLGEIIHPNDLMRETEARWRLVETAWVDAASAAGRQHQHRQYLDSF